jgi:Nup85 Nucleoporin
MSFSVPWPSDEFEPPSTPDRRDLDPIPSTTPVGPPPSGSKSLFFQTGQQPSRNSPAGSNSRSVFQAAPSTHQSFFGASHGFGGPRASQGSSRPATFGFPPSSPPDGDTDERMIDEDEDPASLVQISPGIPTLASSYIGGPNDSMRGTKRPRATNASSNKAKADIRAYAKGIAGANVKTQLDETDDFILGTEEILEELDSEEVDVKNENQAQAAASQTARELIRFWKSQHPMSRDAIEAQKLGASPDSPDSATASLLVSLILPLHHPSAWDLESATKSRPGSALSQKSGAKSIPEVLLGWLAAYHQPGTDVIETVMNSKDDGYAGDPQFWDAVISSLLTGQLTRVISFLSEVDFRKAGLGYTNPQLDYIDQALDLMIELFEQCPAIESEDWDVRGPSWGVFRHHVRQVEDELRTLLDGKEGESENISKSQLSFSLSRSSRMVESCLPQDIHDALYDMCEVLLGDSSVILNSCYDWIEGVMALTIWWDGDEDENMHGSTRQIRRRQTRAVDVTPTLAYRQRLAKSFRDVLEENDLASGIDFSDPVQVGVCCIFEGDNEGLVNVLQTYSWSIASALVQIAKIGGWLSESALEPTTLHGLDQSDLMVLSYANATKPSMKDEVLGSYAQLLAKREYFVDEEGNRTEGWELALMVLSRFDDPYLASQKASELLKRIPLTSPEKVNKLLELCSAYGFADQALQVAEVSSLNSDFISYITYVLLQKFGDDLVGSRASYGDALIYYAKSHNTQKMKELLHTLVTISVVQSRAYPPKNELDPTLEQLLASPKNAISHLNTSDLEAGWFLSTYLSGYATVRRFYQIRDEQINPKSHEDPVTDPQQRKVQGAAALVATISSAADSIRGGLLDPNVNVVIPVDNLLALLGETLVFLNRRHTTFNALI